jgi:hypothetical protein
MNNLKSNNLFLFHGAVCDEIQIIEEDMLVCIASESRNFIGNKWPVNVLTTTERFLYFKKIPLQDLVLYTNFLYKSSIFFKLLENS